MTHLQAFMLGAMVALTPSIVVLAILLWQVRKVNNDG